MNEKLKVEVKTGRSTKVILTAISILKEAVLFSDDLKDVVEYYNSKVYQLKRINTGHLYDYVTLLEKPSSLDLLQLSSDKIIATVTIEKQ